MIMLTSTYSRPSSTSHDAAWLIAGWKLANEALKAWRIRRATERLQGLDDRMLSDIGIGRADIDRAVRQGRSAFY